MRRDPEPIGLFVTKSARILSRAFDEALAAEGGTLPSWLVLASLAGGLHRSQRSIAADLGIDGATVTHHLNRMEADGLVSRQRAPHDKRTQQVELTPAGLEQFGALLKTVIGFDAQLREGFTEAELATLRQLLGRLADNVASATPTTEGTPS
jgi:MarR family transcriptional regulator for hemolysin